MRDAALRLFTGRKHSNGGLRMSRHGMARPTTRTLGPSVELGKLPSVLGAAASAAGVLLSAAALWVAVGANQLAGAANELAADANAVAHDVAQRHEITESFPACTMEFTGSVEVNADGSWGNTTSGSAVYRVVTNTGRLPAMLVGAKARFEPGGFSDEIMLERLTLGNDETAASSAAVYLQPGDAAAVRLSWDLPRNDPQPQPVEFRMLFADGTGADLALTSVNGGGGLPSSIREVYSRLGADPDMLSSCSM